MIPLMKNTFSHEPETRQALAQFILQTPRLSMGQYCQEFEKAFARFHSVAYAVLFNSGSSANLALLQALKNLDYLKVGDKVGFSALTWATNVMPLIQLGFKPIPIDCTIDTFNVMSENLKATLAQQKLKAFFTTNTFGFAGDLDHIQNLCRDQNILLLEDNCECLGSEIQGRKTGTFGKCASFSFYVSHHLSTIEGGMVITEDEELAEMLSLVRSNGWDRNLTKAQQKKWRDRYQVPSEFQAYCTFYDLGYNFRPTEITGFLGVRQLQFLPANIKIRESNYRSLQAIAQHNPDFIPIQDKQMSKLSSFCFPIICKTPQLLAKYLERFRQADVEFRPAIGGNIQKQPFYYKYVTDEYPLPNVNFLHECAFYVGNNPDLSQDDIAVLKNCLILS